MVMNRSRQLSCVLGSMALLMILLGHADATGAGKSETSADRVQATATASKISADGKQTVMLTLAMPKDWHIYANPVGNDSYAEVATRVTVNAGAKVTARVQ